MKLAHEYSVRRKQGVLEKGGWVASVRGAWLAILKRENGLLLFSTLHGL